MHEISFKFANTEVDLVDRERKENVTLQHMHIKKEEFCCGSKILASLHNSSTMGANFLSGSVLYLWWNWILGKYSYFSFNSILFFPS